MEEADLLKERLQAITDKRRIQESITVKRRQIEEEKLKLQYIKKKALREQWLMDGLSQQSEEEQAALKLQAQDEQQQSDQLQSNILRIEKEIEALETEELSISANEEVILKRLKEVERTTEDIIKELNADFHADITNHVIMPHKDVPSFPTLRPGRASRLQEAGCEEPKKATFAMEISVEHDRRTGRSQVVSTATITPETMEERGLKVYDDGHKSVYALHTDGGPTPTGAVGEMTSKEVEELLHKAVDKDVPTEVQYHLPVYSTPYTGNSRPSTPRTPSKTQRLTPSTSPSPLFKSGTIREGHQRSPEPEGWKTPSPSLTPQESTSKERLSPFFNHREQSNNDSQISSGAKTPHGLAKSRTDASSPRPAALVSVTARSEGMPPLIQPVYMTVENQSPLPPRDRSEVDPDSIRGSPWDSRYSPFSAESTPSLNLVSTLPEDQDSQPITMIFMGYENAEEDEDEDIQAELVVIGNSDEDDDDDADFNGSRFIKNENHGEECLSYHPEGCKSKVFQPKVGTAKVPDCRDSSEDAYTGRDDSGLHKPTFIHKPGKHSPYLQGQGGDGSAKTGSINLEKMKLCSTGR